MKVKLLFVNADMSTGGIEKVLADTLSYLDFDKYSVDLLLTRYQSTNYTIPSQVNIYKLQTQIADGPLMKAILRCIHFRAWTALLYRILLFGGKFIGEKQVLKIIGKWFQPSLKYDYIIALRPDMVGKLVGYGMTSAHKDMWWHHGDLGLYNKHDLSDQFQYFDRIIATSSSLKEYLKEIFPEHSSKITVIPNGINISMISKMSVEFNPYKQYPSKIHIVSVGRINPEKRYEYVIEAAKQLIKSNFPPFQWHIIGDGIEYNYIKDLIQKLNLEEYVIMHGNQINPYPYIKYANIFVHTSFVESVGLAILEAMSLYVPCVVTKSKGPASYISNTKNGFLVNGSVDLIVEAIFNITDGTYNIDLIKKNAYKTAQSYSIDSVKLIFENLFT